jgi:glycosyltransferase involved in cell wall biosynthesis
MWPGPSRPSRRQALPPPATDNGGLATARNRAIAVTSAPFIALLDGDDLYSPTIWKKCSRLIQADAALGFVSCDA